MQQEGEVLVGTLEQLRNLNLFSGQNTSLLSTLLALVRDERNFRRRNFQRIASVSLSTKNGVGIL